MINMYLKQKTNKLRYNATQCYCIIASPRLLKTIKIRVVIHSLN